MAVAIDVMHLTKRYGTARGCEDVSLSALFGINGSLTTPDGWLSGNIYADFLPLILLFITIGHGAATLAGEEGRGRLDLVMALPVARRSVVVQKATAMTLTASAVAVVTFLASLVGRAFDVDISVFYLAATTVGALLMALGFGLLPSPSASRIGSRRRTCSAPWPPSWTG